MKRRLLKITGIVFAVLLFTGYFTFSTFLFSPLEGDYEYELATLVPRDVDFFVSKEDLAGEFAGFPRLDYMRRLGETERGQRLMNSPEWKEQEAALGIDTWTADLQAQLDALPIPIDPLAIAGGREVALAGYATGRDFQSSEWAVYLRTNWAGKLGLSLLDYPAALGLGGQGIAVESGDGFSILSGGEIPGQLFVTRLRDVLIASNVERLVTGAFDLDLRAGEDSMGQSASYHDNVKSNVRDNDEVKLSLDYADAAVLFGLPLEGPNATSPEAGEAFLGRLFQYKLIREFTGLLGFRRGLSVELVGELDSEAMSPLQRKLYRRRDADQRAVVERLARYAPQDVGLFLHVESDLEDLLKTFLSSIERAARSNLETEILRPVFGFDGVDAWAADLATVFGDEVAFFVRENDFAVAADDPPNDGLPTLVWAAVLNIEDRDKLDEIQSKISGNQARFGIRGPESGSGGIFYNEDSSGNLFYEYWAPLMPGTGHLASMIDQNSLVISNHFRMIGLVLATYYGSDPNRPSLSSFGAFEGLVNSGLPSATVSAWLNPRTITEGLRAIEAQRAEDDAFADIDWAMERQRLEKKVLKERYPDEVWGALSPGIDQQIEPLVDEELEVFRIQYRAQRVPALLSRAERLLDAYGVLRYGLVQLRLELKDFQFEARLIAPAED